MDLPTNSFKRAIKAGRQQIGLWSSLSSHVTVEIIAGSGYDWQLLDTEHSPNEIPMVHSQLQASTGGTAHPVVRPPWNDTVMIKRFLDIGTQTLLIPYVQTEEEAQNAVAATRYPPKGVRGFAGSSRAMRFGRVKEYFKRYEEELCVLVQVETRQSLTISKRSPRSMASTAFSSVRAISRPVLVTSTTRRIRKSSARLPMRSSGSRGLVASSSSGSGNMPCGCGSIPNGWPVVT